MTATQKVFDRIAELDPSKIQGINTVILFDLSGDGGGKWTLTLADGQAKVEDGETASPSMTLLWTARTLSPWPAAN